MQKAEIFEKKPHIQSILSLRNAMIEIVFVTVWEVGM